MNHAITVRDMLLVGGMILGVVGVVGGLIFAEAYAMSPRTTENSGVGCIAAIIGLLMFCGCLARLVF